MSVARQTFLDRLNVLRKAVAIEAVTDKASVEHNETARMLRNGLAVVGFAALEDYIKTRSGEILSSIGSIGIPFSSLPEKIRLATTSGVVDALSYQISLRDETDAINFTQLQSQKISSTVNSSYDLTPFAFGYNRANVSAEMIKNILMSFFVKDPWGQMTNISSALGLTALSLNESYKNAFHRRHKAAHAPNANTPQLDIEQFVKEAVGIAISFDCLMSKSLQLIKVQDRDYLLGKKPPSSSHIHFRIIRFSNKKWKEYSPLSNRAIKTNDDVSTLILLAAARATRNGETLVLFDLDGNLRNWECY